MRSTGRPCSSISRERHDADHARVPPVLREDDTVRGVEVERLDELARARERPAIDFLAVAIELLQLARDRVRLVLVLGHQELDAAQRVAEPAHGIEPRGEDEADAARIERLSLEPGRADEGANALVGRLLHYLEPRAREHAILAAQRCDVRDGRERDQVEHAGTHFSLPSHCARERERELERDADRREILVGILTPVALRIQNRQARGQGLQGTP